MIGFFRAPWDVRLKNMYASRRKKNSTEKIRPTKLQQYKIEKLIQFGPHPIVYPEFLVSK